MSFSDAEHGWFLWKTQTSAAFSAGKLLSTEDGGATWTELPDPPSGNGMQFHTRNDGWMTGGAAADELWSTHDGGKTWQQKFVPPPTNCNQCRPVYHIPAADDSYNAVIPVTFVDESVREGRHFHGTYVTSDAGESWQATQTYEQRASSIKTPLVSSRNMKTVHVFSDAQHGIQIQAGATTTSSSYPKGLPPRGSIAASDFTGDLNGWLLHQAYKCNRFRNRASDGPGLPCVDGVLRSDLLSTSDGGKSFRVITPSVTSGSSQR